MFDKVWDFYTDSKHKLTKKFLLSVLAIIALLSIDYFFRFSDSYIAEKKIEQLGKIQEIIKQDSLRSAPKQELLEIEKEIISRPPTISEILLSKYPYQDLHCPGIEGGFAIKILFEVFKPFTPFPFP